MCSPEHGGIITTSLWLLNHGRRKVGILRTSTFSNFTGLFGVGLAFGLGLGFFFWLVFVLVLAFYFILLHSLCPLIKLSVSALVSYEVFSSLLMLVTT